MDGDSDMIRIVLAATAAFAIDANVVCETAHLKQTSQEYLGCHIKHGSSIQVTCWPYTVSHQFAHVCKLSIDSSCRPVVGANICCDALQYFGLYWRV